MSTSNELRPLIKLSPNLPISEAENDILSIWKQHSILILQSETGSGKSTQIPKIAFNLLRHQSSLRIAMTQPRRLATRILASRLQHEFQAQGLSPSHIGWQIRHQKHTSATEWMTVMTEGILLQQLLHDRLLSRYDVILLDEVHERSIQMDLLCGFLKEIVQKRPSLKIGLLSATLDLELFQKFFPQAHIFHSPGRSYPVTSHYWDPAIPSRSNETFERLLWALNQADYYSGDILIFCATEYEIITYREKLEKRFPHYEFLPLYSRLSPSEQNKVFDIQKRGPKRRVILSTNVAQTSLTIPHLGVVIDLGTQKIMQYHSKMLFASPQIVPIAQDAILQRKGRAGRLREGVCFHLYPEEEMRTRPLYSTPEILRSHCMAIALKIFAIRPQSLDSFPFITPPERSQLNQAVDALLSFQLIEKNYHLTTLGQEIVRSSYDPRLALVLKESVRLGVSGYIGVIVSFFSAGDVRLTPLEKRQQALHLHQQDVDAQSDFLTIIRLWLRVKNAKEQLSRSQFQKFLNEQFIHPLLMHQWMKECESLEANIIDFPSESNIIQIHRALLAGFWDMVFQKQPPQPDGLKRYAGARNTQIICPLRVKGSSEPEWIVALDIQKQRNGSFMPRWFAPISEHDILHYAKSRLTIEDRGLEYCPVRKMVFAVRVASLWGLKIKSLGRHWVMDHATNAVREVGLSGLILQLTEDETHELPLQYRNHSWVRLFHNIQKIAHYSRTQHLVLSRSELVQFAIKNWPRCIFDGPSFLEHSHQIHFKESDFWISPPVPCVNIVDFPDTLRKDGYDILFDYHPEESHTLYSISISSRFALRIHPSSWMMLHPYYKKRVLFELLECIPAKSRAQLDSATDLIHFFFSEYQWPEPWEKAFKKFLQEYYDLELNYTSLPLSVRAFFPTVWSIDDSENYTQISLEHRSTTSVQKGAQNHTVDRDFEIAQAFKGHLLKIVAPNGEISIYSDLDWFRWRADLLRDYAISLQSEVPLLIRSKECIEIVLGSVVCEQFKKFTPCLNTSERSVLKKKFLTFYQNNMQLCQTIRSLRQSGSLNQIRPFSSQIMQKGYEAYIQGYFLCHLNEPLIRRLELWDEVLRTLPSRLQKKPDLLKKFEEEWTKICMMSRLSSTPQIDHPIWALWFEWIIAVFYQPQRPITALSFQKIQNLIERSSSFQDVCWIS